MHLKFTFPVVTGARVQEVHTTAEVVNITPGLLGLGVLYSSHAYEMYCETYD